MRDAPSGRYIAVYDTGDGNVLVAFTGPPPGEGPCAADYSVVAEQSGTTTDLTVVDRRPSAQAGDCETAGHLWALRAPVDAGRTAVTVGGSPVEVKPASALAAVPAGFRLMGLLPEQSKTVYGNGGGRVLVLQRQAPDAAALPAPYEAFREADVAGTRVVVARSGDDLVASWPDGDTSLLLFASGPGPGDAWSPEELLAAVTAHLTA